MGISYGLQKRCQDNNNLKFY